MRAFLSGLMLALVIGCSMPTVDVGTIDQKLPPAEKDLVAPKVDKDIDAVGLYARVKGRTDKNEQGKVYVLVNPLSNPDTRNVWWVQREVSRKEDTFEATAQFGEESVGLGEYFAIVVVATDREFTVGEMLTGIPEKATYTKLKIVKRKP